MMDNTYNIENMLIRWQVWCHIGTGIPKRPKCLLGKMLNTQRDEDDYDPLTTTEAESLHRALDALKNKNPKAHEAIIVRYQKGIFSDKKASKLCGCSIATLKNRRSQGLNFLDGALTSI